MRYLTMALCCGMLFLSFPAAAFSQAEPEPAAQPVLPATGADTESSPAAAVVPASRIIEIFPLEEGGKKYSFELRDADVGDLFRLLAHDYKLNLVIDKDVSGTVTASFSNITLEEALDEIAEAQGLVLERKNNVIRIRLNLVTKVFVLKFIEASKLITPSADSSSVQQGEGTTGEGDQLKQASTLLDLLSPKGKVLLGNTPNSLMVIDYPKNIDKIEAFLKAVDKKMSKRVFKLKYLKASELMEGKKTDASPGSQSSSAAVPGDGAAAP